MITDYMEENGLFDIFPIIDALQKLDGIDNDFWENCLKEEDFDE